MYILRISIILIFLTSSSCAAQVIPNAGFEDYYEHSGEKVLPQNYRARATTLQHHGFDANTGFNSKGSGLFDTSGLGSKIGYFYAFHNAEGKQPKYLPVKANERYRISIRYKMDEMFFNSKNSGVYLQALFFNSEMQDNGLPRAISQIDSKRAKAYKADRPEDWQILEYEISVTENIESMGVGVYFEGEGKVWVDDFLIERTENEANISHKANVSSTEISPLTFSNIVKLKEPVFPQYIEAVNWFEESNTLKETNLASSVWSLKPPNCHPQIRLSSNIVISLYRTEDLWNRFDVEPVNYFFEKAENYLDWLVSKQQPNGSFYWYPASNCNDPIKDPGSIMYEGSIAAMSLLEGYMGAKDAVKRNEYLISATKFADYLLTLPPHANTNFNGFAIWFLSNYSMISEISPANDKYLAHALKYFDHIASLQTTEGYWPDYHNKHIYYHAIITRGIISLFLATQNWSKMDAAEAEKLKVSTYRAINHNISQIRNSRGELQKHPDVKDELISTSFSLEVVLLAQRMPNLDKKEVEILETAATILANFDPRSSQGHKIASIGLYLSYKYK